MILPSNELLSAVLDIKVDIVYINPRIDYNKHIWYDLSCGDTESINIYELMNMMKEWAYNKYSYELQSYSNGNGICYTFFKDAAYGGYEDFYKEDTEPEAVTKACELILEQQK